MAIDSALSWRQWAFALISQVLLPLLPIGLEKYFTSTVSESGLSMAAAMFCLSVGASSRYLVVFTLSFLAGLFLSACYGYTLAHPNKLAYLSLTSEGSIITFGAGFTVERFARHVLGKEVYVDFK